MSQTLKMRFENTTATVKLFSLEPWAQEIELKPGEHAILELRGEIDQESINLVMAEDGLIVWINSDCEARILVGDTDTTDWLR